jgi:hypothetical protein
VSGLRRLSGEEGGVYLYWTGCILGACMVLLTSDHLFALCSGGDVPHRYLTEGRRLRRSKNERERSRARQSDTTGNDLGLPRTQLPRCRGADLPSRPSRYPRSALPRLLARGKNKDESSGSSRAMAARPSGFVSKAPLDP